MKKQLQLIACAAFMVLTGLTGYGQNIGDIFTADDITYEVTSLSNLNMVTITETGNENRGDFIIPENVTYRGNDFTVTVIGAGAFGDNGLIRVTIPSSVIQITANAFIDNPDLKRVVSKNTNPPRLDPSAFGDRSDIALIVPEVSISIYENVAFGWTGFKSITGEVSDVTEGLEYNVTNTNPNTAEVIGYQGTATNVNIPETVTIGNIDYTVTRIGDNAFNPLPPFDNKALTSVAIPNSVTSIGNGAFMRSQLQGHLEIPNSVTSIENDAFNSRNVDTGLASVTIPNSVTHIGQRAFAGNRLKNVTIPDQLEVLEGGVFSGNSINEIIIPKSVTEIQGSAFKDNDLVHVYIPSNVTKIGQTAFITGDTGDESLVTVGIESSDPPVLDISNGDCNRVFRRDCDNGPLTVIVPRGARDAYIADDHWNDLAIIEELPVGSSFTYSDVPFVQERSMIYQVISDLDKTVRVTGRVASGLLDVIIPEKVFYGISYTVTAVGKNAFLDNGLTSVTIPNSVTRIEKGAFENNALTTVTLPEGVTSIGTRAFKNSGLTGHLEIPDNIITFGGGAFSNNQLTSVTIPNNLHAFADAGDRDTNTVENTMAIGLFQGNLLTEVTIPDNVQNIEKGVFGNNPELSTVVMKNPNPITLDPEAFDLITVIGGLRVSIDRRPLIDVIVPRSDPPGRNKHRYLVGSGWADHGFKSIQEEGDIGEIFTIEDITYKITEFNPNRVTIIDNTNTGDFTIPKNVEKLQKAPYAIFEDTIIEFTITGIEAGAFQNNQLTRVIIPDSITSIGANAFVGNPGLATVELEGTDPPSIEESTFANRDQIDVIVAHGGFDNYVPAWNDFNFRSIKAKVNVGDTFTVERDANTAVIKYEVTAFDPTNTVTVINNEDDDRRLLEIFDRVAHVGHEFKVIKIGEHAFAERNIIGALTIPDGVESIGAYAFSNNALNSIAIPNNVTSIGEGAFSENQLTSVGIPESVKTIGHRVFAGNSLTEVNIPNNATGIGDGAFQDNQLISVTIPENVTGIGANAFADNPDLATVISMAFAPPSIEESTFTNADRAQIDLIVPSATPAGRIRANYEDAGWTGFRSIKEGIGVSIDAPAEITNLSTFTVTFRFDQDVTGFTMENIDLGNAVANNFTGSGSIYTVEITPASCDGTISIDLPVNAVNMSYSTNLPASAKVAVEANSNDLVAIARNIMLQLDANGGATISPEDIDDGSYSCDGGTPQLSLDMDTFDCGNVGTPVMVTLTATQGDQTATATAMVTVFGNCGSGSGSPLADFNRGISPNGDGIADNLVIQGLEKYKNNEVKIYNLSQRLVFSAHYGGPSDAWDGTHKGSLVPVGSYVCVIDYNEPGLNHETKMIYVNY